MRCCYRPRRLEVPGPDNDPGADPAGQWRLADPISTMRRSQYASPTVFIETASLFGDLAYPPHFVLAYGWALDSRHHKGARATLEALVR